ncbi:ABC transporter permease [Bacillus sp. 03113]|uniref:ABC transporter permease n=1 Tax=Bacillus sp. 03113 TaxID=2578211 RepID=UPI001143E8EE|nr:ABC transporter permease [Bacillus sp. 03113]
MLKLVQNEWMKIFNRPGTYVMLVLLVLMVSVMGAVIKYQENGVKIPNNDNWRSGLEEQNKSFKQQLEEMDGAGYKEAKEHIKRQMVINQYRLDHNISPNQEEYSAWDFVKDASNLISIAGLFTIIVAAGIVASEFNWGTIKLLLIRPISRWKVLLSKYLTVLLFGLMMLFILFVFSTLLGAVLFGFPEAASPYLNYFNGKVTEQTMLVHLIIFYGLNSITLLMLSTMAFMISAVFRNSSLAIGISIFLMFMGAQGTRLLAMKFDWAKYILFANTDLMQYFEGVPMVKGMTLTFSTIMLILYYALFIFLAFYIFKKRDVAA